MRKNTTLAIVLAVALLFSGAALNASPASGSDYTSYSSSYSCPPGFSGVPVAGGTCVRTVDASTQVPVTATFPDPIYSCPPGSTGTPVVGGTCVTATGEEVSVITTVAAPIYSCPAGTTGTPVAGGTCTLPGTAVETAPVIETVVYGNPIDTAMSSAVLSGNTIAGNVSAGGTGCPCPIVLSTNVGTISTMTNADGTFSLSIPAGASGDITVMSGTAVLGVITVPAASTGPVTTTTPATTTTTTATPATVVTTGVAAPAVDYGFNNQGIPAQPALAVTGASTSLLGFIATALIALGALALASRRKGLPQT